MKIYVAGALSNGEENRSDSKVVTDYIQNAHRMCKVAGQLMKMGHSPFILLGIG